MVEPPLGSSSGSVPPSKTQNNTQNQHLNGSKNLRKCRKTGLKTIRRTRLVSFTYLFYVAVILLTLMPTCDSNIRHFRDAFTQHHEAHPFNIGKAFHKKKKTKGKLPVPDMDGPQSGTYKYDENGAEQQFENDGLTPAVPHAGHYHGWSLQSVAMVLAFMLVIGQVGYALYVWSFGAESELAEKNKGAVYFGLKRIASAVKSMPVYKPASNARATNISIIYIGLFTGYVGISALATMWIALLPAWEVETGLGWSKDLSAFLVTLTMTAFVVGEFSLGSSLPRVFGGHKSVLAVMLMLLLCGSLLIVSQRPFIITVLVTVIVMLYGSVFVLFSHVSKKVLPPSEFGRILMLIGVAAEMGDSITSFTFSSLLKSLAWQMGVIAIVVFSFCTFFVYWAFVPHVERYDDFTSNEEQVAFIEEMTNEEEGGFDSGFTRSRNQSPVRSRYQPMYDPDSPMAIQAEWTDEKESSKPLLLIFKEIMSDRVGWLVLCGLVGAHITEVYPVILPAIVADRFSASPSAAGLAKSFYCWGAMVMLVASAATASLPNSQARFINLGMVTSACFGFAYMALIASTLVEVNFCNFLAGGGSAVGMFAPFIHFRDDPNTSVKIAIAGTTAAVCAMLVGAVVGWGHAHLTAISEWEMACGLCSCSLLMAIGAMVLQFESLGFVPPRPLSPRNKGSRRGSIGRRFSAMLDDHTL